jgi:hypothetical protein
MSEILLLIDGREVEAGGRDDLPKVFDKTPKIGYIVMSNLVRVIAERWPSV